MVIPGCLATSLGFSGSRLRGTGGLKRARWVLTGQDGPAARNVWACVCGVTLINVRTSRGTPGNMGSHIQYQSEKSFPTFRIV